jgi:cell fate (sporulation/competence/biofilm development) regulator YlbF (YheA/YmcA/DUF963 family)
VSEIIDLATKLGKAIAESPQAAALKQSRKALEDQPEMVKLLQEYNQQAQKIGQLEEQNKVIEVDDKRKLQELHEKLVASDVFKKMQMAQMEYVDLMRKVSMGIHEQLKEIER